MGFIGGSSSSCTEMDVGRQHQGARNWGHSPTKWGTIAQDHQVCKLAAPDPPVATPFSFTWLWFPAPVVSLSNCAGATSRPDLPEPATRHKNVSMRVHRHVRNRSYC